MRGGPLENPDSMQKDFAETTSRSDSQSQAATLGEENKKRITSQAIFAGKKMRSGQPPDRIVS
jgi:hypothetical protein